MTETTSDAKSLVDRLGELYSDIKSQCIQECVQLLETHELTVAERDCSNNCFKKYSNAYARFNNLAFSDFEKFQRYQANNI